MDLKNKSLQELAELRRAVNAEYEQRLFPGKSIYKFTQVDKMEFPSISNSSETAQYWWVRVEDNRNGIHFGIRTNSLFDEIDVQFAVFDLMTQTFPNVNYAAEDIQVLNLGPKGMFLFELSHKPRN